MTAFGDALTDLTVKGIEATFAAHDRCCDCGERFGEREHRGRCLIHPNEPHHMMPCAKYETAGHAPGVDDDPDCCYECWRKARGE